MYKYPIDVKVYKGWGLPSGSIYLQQLFHDFQFIVRGITRREYADWTRDFPNQSDLEGKILREAVVDGPKEFMGKPWDWDECFAGVAEQVLEKIYGVSGFGDKPDPAVTEAVEKYLNSEEARFDLVIMAANPSYRLLELMEMDHRDWHMEVGMSQLKLAILAGIDSEEILYPEQAKKKKGGVAVPKGRQLSQEEFSNPGTGAKPFFGPNARAKHPDSPYPAGHPRNPAVVDDKGIPGMGEPIAFFSE